MRQQQQQKKKNPRGNDENATQEKGFNFQVIRKDSINLPQILSKDKNLFIDTPDKSGGILIIYASTYNVKIGHILDDTNIYENNQTIKSIRRVKMSTNRENKYKTCPRLIEYYLKIPYKTPQN